MRDPTKGAERSRRYRARHPEKVAAARRAAMRAYRMANPNKVRSYERSYYAQHRETLTATKRRSRARNREVTVARNRTYVKSNQEKVAAYQRRYRECNREAIRAAKRAYANRNRDNVLQWSREKSARYRARKRNAVIIPFTSEQLGQRLSMFGNRCWMCGISGSEVDHVKPLACGGPHCLSNLRPACKTCNSRKRDQWPLVA